MKKTTSVLCLFEGMEKRDGWEVAGGWMSPALLLLSTATGKCQPGLDIRAPHFWCKQHGSKIASSLKP